MERHGGGVVARGRAELPPEERHLVRDLERAPASCALLQHRRREGRESREVRRIASGPGVHEHLHVHERHLVHLDDGDREPVRQGVDLHGRQFEGWRRRERRGLGAVDSLGGQSDGRTEPQQHYRARERQGFPERT